MGLLFDLFGNTPASTIAEDMAAKRHAEVMSALRALQATLAAKRGCGLISEAQWQPPQPGPLRGDNVRLAELATAHRQLRERLTMTDPLALILEEIAADPTINAAMDRYRRATNNPAPINFMAFQKWLAECEPELAELLERRSAEAFNNGTTST